MDEKHAYEPEYNDDDIMDQQRAIQKEIEMSQPLLSPEADIAELLVEYAANDVMSAKAGELKAKYKSFRRIRGDGNCMYRAFLFATLRRFIQDKNKAGVAELFSCILAFLCLWKGI
jgi:ubiquitin thioesterase protein OTUB1